MTESAHGHQWSSYNPTPTERRRILWKRWRVTAHDVDGRMMAEVSQHWTHAGATIAAAKYLHTIPEPIPGRPLYTVRVCRALRTPTRSN